jgi:hypothetical protein
MKSAIKYSAVFIIVILCTLLPVHQAALSAQTEQAIESTGKAISDSMNQISLLTARVSQSSTPEFLSWSAGNLGDELKQIQPESNYYVKEETSNEER